MNAKRYFLAAVMLVGMSISALAQQPTTYPATLRSSGLTVAPWPFKQTDRITLTVNTTQTYPRTGMVSMNGATGVFIHASANTGEIGPNGKRWDTQTISPGDWRTYPATRQFTAVTGMANTWSLAITPSTWFPIPAGVNISELCFVLNDGTGGMREGGAAPAAGTTDAKSDFFVPLGAVASSVQNSDIFTAANSYPNPATEVVNINFGLKSTGNVTLKIFSAQGVEVATLLDGNTMSGNALHIMQWDVTNAAGKKVPSGVYFFRLMVNGATETGKIMVN